MTEQGLIDAIREADYADEVIEVLKKRNVTSKVLKVAVARAETLIPSLLDDRDVYDAVLHSPKLTVDIINKIIDKIDISDDYYRRVYMAIFANPVTSMDIKHQICNSLTDEMLLDYWIEDILRGTIDEDLALKFVDLLTSPAGRQYCTTSYIEELLISIIDNKGCTKKVLSAILMHTNLAKVINAALKSPVADEDLKLDLMLAKKNLTNADIDKIFSNKNITSETVCRIIRVHNTDEIIKRALELPNIDIPIYKTIVEAIYFKKDPTDDIMIRNILKRDLDEEVLCEIVKRTDTFNIIVEVSEHKNAGLNVVREILTAVDRFKDAERSTLIRQAKNLKNSILSKIYNVEKEENVTEMLRRNVEDGITTMLWGPSGVGKSSRVFEIDPTATMLILKNGMLPEDVIGGREPNGNPGEIYPPHWYKVLCEKCQREPDRQHILFIDEFTNVSDTVKNLVWEVIGNRLVNGHEEWALPENCSIVVAGNRPEESSAVRMDHEGGIMPAPLHNRIESMIEIEFDIEEWMKWAIEINANTGRLRIHPIVYSFCVPNADKVMFTQYDPENVTQPFLSPRKWETLSKAIYSAQEQRGKNTLISVGRIKSILGDNPISDAFIEHYYRIPFDVSKIESGEYKPGDFPTVEDKLYALGIIIAEYHGDAIALEDFILECLGDEYLSIYNNVKNNEQGVIEANKSRQVK